MTVNFITGDLFASDAKTLVCPVNTMGKMGAGLAKQFRERFVGLNTAYKVACQRGMMQPGDLWLWQSPNTKHVTQDVLCIATKFKWQEPSQLLWIEYSLDKFAREFKQYAPYSVAFPKIGCGLGGLDWRTQVWPLMIEYLSDLPIEVYVYE